MRLKQIDTKKRVINILKNSSKYTEYDDNCFFNRELSALDFNARILEEATFSKTPLLEKLKFLTICNANLDEFFMVRVAGLKKMRTEGFSRCESPDRMTITTALEKIRIKTLEISKLKYLCLKEQVLPQLKKEGINIVNYSELNTKQKKEMSKYFEDEVLPILTPLAVDSTHPLPFLANLSLFLLIEFVRDDESLIGFVEIPSIISRLIPLHKKNEEGKPLTYEYLYLEDLIQSHLNMLFIGLKTTNIAIIRVTRNLDYKLLENKVVDLLESIQKEVANRELQEVVRLETWGSPSQEAIEKLTKLLEINPIDIYKNPNRSLFVTGMMELYELPLDHLKEVHFNPRIPARVAHDTRDIFSIIRSKDLLIHLPYESFYTVTELLNAAAVDPDVLAIKQTLYRCSENSPVIDSLIRASENGKQVTAIVELKARFDEKNNIIWAQRLERAGVNVIYGFVHLKTHCKACLVVRKESKKLTRYVHLSTGNYNPITAKQYTDLGIFSSRETLGRDISSLFNFLTGFNFLSSKKLTNIEEEFVPKFNQILVAPVNLRERLAIEIFKLIKKSKSGKKVRISAKMNGLVDKTLISLLYEASKAGVKIRLIVRGICCLRPGVKGMSDNIKVISILDRFLEHGRIYIFEDGDQRKIYLGSADLMDRNMDRRIEILFPILDEEIQNKVVSEVFELSWKDNVKSRTLKNNGDYVLSSPSVDEQDFRSQNEFIKLAREEGIKSIPYEKAIRYDALKNKGGRPIVKKVQTRKKDHKKLSSK